VLDCGVIFRFIGGLGAASIVDAARMAAVRVVFWGVSPPARWPLRSSSVLLKEIPTSGKRGSAHADHCALTMAEKAEVLYAIPIDLVPLRWIPRCCRTGLG
jgi:hypothetical protein